MYKTIVLAYDGSETGQKALLDCCDIAQWSQAALSLVAVMPISIGLVGVEGGFFSSELMDQEKPKYQDILSDGLGRLQEAGFQASGQLLVGEVVDEITRHARSVKADLLVVGHQHRSSWAARWWRGSISGSLIEHSSCSVLVVITNP
jgi:nucleotide-binding universal stress UspA family protein